MLQDKINRINELARKSRNEGLTPEEKKEQQKLRREYIDAFKKSLMAELENTVVVDENGNRRKLTKND